MKGKRRFTRVEFPIEGQYEFIGEKFPVKIRDISVRGLFIEVLNTPVVGAEISIEIPLSENQSTIIRAEARIIRNCSDGFAVEFTKIDIDSFAHVKNIVAYHFGDTEKVVKEISEGAGIH
ncbi:MAG: PilZ domain-containing protein [Leptospirales bacterium]